MQMFILVWNLTLNPIIDVSNHNHVELHTGANAFIGVKNLTVLTCHLVPNKSPIN